MKPNTTPGSERPAGTRWLAIFQKFARHTVRSSGHPLAFALALGTVVLWAVTGPLFNSGNTWLLIINTITNIVTFLMIFLIRNAQNRESEAVQLKLDELIRATTSAQNSFLDIEELSEADLDRIKARFERLARKSRESSVTAGTNFLHHQEDRRAAVVGEPTPPTPP